LLTLDLSLTRTGRLGPDPLVVRHVLAYDHGATPSAYGWRRNGHLYVEVPGVAIFELAPNGDCLTAVPQESVEPQAVLDAYYGTALPLVLQATRGLEVFHGSAVLSPSRGWVVAACGISGAGKSTIAYGLAARGYRHWADDAVAFQPKPPSFPTTVGLPFAVGGSPGTLDVIEEFAWKPAPLRAIFLLEPGPYKYPGNRAVALERLAPARALRALLPNTFRFQPHTQERRRATMRSYLELVACVPVLSVSFRHDFDRLAELLDELQAWIGDLA
jgi:hypothetical protein